MGSPRRKIFKIAADQDDTRDAANATTLTWRTDLDAVTPEFRRAAIYVLRLLATRKGNSDFFDDDGDHETTCKLLAPLLVEGVAAVAVDEEEDDAPFRGRRQRNRARLIATLPEDLLDRLLSIDTAGPTHETVRALGEMLDLDAVELALLDFLEKRHSVGEFQNFLRSRGTADPRGNLECLAGVLDVNPTELRRAMADRGTLRRTRLIANHRHVWQAASDLEDFVAPSDEFAMILFATPATVDELISLLIEPAPAPELSLDDFPHLAEAAARLVPALRRAAAGGIEGVNALLYGRPGTGKTEFAHALARAAGLTLYRVRSADDDGDGMGRQGRLAAYLIAQKTLRMRRDALILFDEAEDAFADEEDAFGRMFGKGRRTVCRQKGWINRLLEENVVPAIWISNDVETMDAAVLRRFLLPVEFTLPPRGVRRRIADRHLGQCNLPASLLDDLAGDEQLAPAQFGAARRLLLLRDEATLADATAADGAGSFVRESVTAMRRLLHGSGVPLARRSPTQFDPDLLNIGGNIAPTDLVNALARTGQGRLCFYGPPGTGKTEFAHAIADQLGRELVVRAVSDLVSPYVGETEARIAALFRSIDAGRTVLLLDEVDSLLRDRRQAQRGWEVTQVNELLQQMERYQGILIAATNLVGGLDAAALRRFDFKLSFQPLTAPQRVAMFAREALGGAVDPATLTPRLREVLLRLDGVTLGDFANVCRQREMLGVPLAPEDFVRRLAQESRWRAAAAA